MSGALIGAVFPWLYGHLVDAAVDGTRQTIIAFAIAIGLAQALSAAARSVSGLLNWNLWERMTVTIDRELVSLATRLGLVDRVEDSDYREHLTLVRTNREHFQESMSSLQYAVLLALQVLVTVLLLLTVAPLLLLLPVFALVPILATRWAEARTQRALSASVADTRTADGMALLAFEAGAAGELRLLRMGDLVLERQREAWRRAVARQWRAELVGTLATTGALALFTVGFAGALLYVTRRSLDGEGSLGEVVLVLTAGQQLHTQIGSLLANSGALFRIVETMRHLLWLHEYVDRNEQRGSRPPPVVLTRGIELADVSFRYADATRDAVAGASLLLPAGRIVAVVGDNGAGKSTLASLLCGLQEPTSGKVRVDGHDLAELDGVAWRRVCTAAFQEFVRYELYAREAVGLGRVELVEDDDAVRAALAAADVAELEAELPEGLATPLGTAIHDGADLSGGQWQKLALARSMMREQPLLRILDEPTYSLDVESERHVFDWFAHVAGEDSSAGTITVIVSHRFSTVRTADLVVVMADGRPIEIGTHADLLAAGGHYAAMYRTQAHGYQ